MRRGYSYEKTVPQALLKRITTDFGRKTTEFPIDFSQKAKSKRSFLRRLIGSNSRINKCFENYIAFLQDPKDNEFVETRLAQKTQESLRANQKKVKVLKCQVSQIQLLYDNLIYGVFFHRQLNLPSDCYSFSVEADDSIKYVMKDRLTRQDRMKELFQIKEKYTNENWNFIYLESYDYFTKKECIKRYIYQISADLTLEFTTPRGVEIIGREPTKHLLQVQQIKYPYDQSNFYVTDVDFFMKGNPYTLNN